MNALFTRLITLLSLAFVAIAASIANADPLPGRDLTKFSQLPMIATPILLRITGGSGFGLPSPGHTTLTRLGPAGSNWNVDSFFDITYRIDFVGHPGGPFGGMSGSTTGTGRFVVGAIPEPAACSLLISGVLSWPILAAATVMTMFCSAQVPASVIDFETTPAGLTPMDDSFLSSGTPYNIPGLQVSFGFDTDSNGSIDSDGRFEQTGTYQGEPISAFQGSSGADTPDPGFAAQLGNWFLQSPTPGSQFGRFAIQYSSTFPVTAASGEIWDIDGNQTTGVTEQYTIQAFDSSSSLLSTIVSPTGTLDTASAPLDGEPWVFTFSGLSNIDHIVITFTGTKTSGIGLAFNNFYPTTAVPEPSTVLLGLIGAAIVGYWSRRRSWPANAHRP
jgi:hypothetical protein